MVTFADLQEFSNYRIMVTATFNAFGTDVNAAVAMADFTTPSAGESTLGAAECVYREPWCVYELDIAKHCVSDLTGIGYSDGLGGRVVLDGSCLFNAT
jgi:hypothetical protein